MARVNVDTTLNVVCCSNCLLAAAGPSLGSELAGTMRHSSSSVVGDFSRLPITETSRAAYGRHWVGLRQPRLEPISHSHQLTSRDPTFAPRTPATSPENNHCVHQSPARVSYGGMCRGRGKMWSTGADDCRPYRAVAMSDSHCLEP